MSDDISEKVIALYQQMDEQTTALQTATELQCPAGCGRCCENPEIEATPLDLLPAAMELLRRGEAQQCLEKVTNLQETDLCTFYRPDPASSGKGRCSMYDWRPTVCRLFGFAAVKNKQGQLELAACARHKEIMPEVVDKAKEAIAAGLPAPSFSDFASQVANLDPYLGQQRMPLNLALKVAIERAGLMAQFIAQKPPDSGA